MREVDWMPGDRRFPGELHLPGVACIVRVQARIERSGTLRHFALNLVRAAEDKHFIRPRRKLATWTPHYLETLLNAEAK
jgi:hypothetical protein